MGIERSALVEVGVPALAALAGLGILGLWTYSYFTPREVAPRALGSEIPIGTPLQNQPPPAAAASPSASSPVDQTSNQAGAAPTTATTVSSAAPLTLIPGSWPGFRGPNRDNVAPSGSKVPEAVNSLAMLWKIKVGEGYAGPAVHNSRVYLIDYDTSAKQDVLRCLSLADGKEIWRNAYPNDIKRFHGMSRSVPSTDGALVVSLGPSCHLLVADAISGKTIWMKDLVQEYGSKVPDWYSGQCPLLIDGKVIVAPSGPSALMVAFDAKTGKELWRTPNPDGWKMTHSSIAPMTLNGVPQYVYCGSGGVAGVSAKDGKILWKTDEWRIDTATVPTPVSVGEDRIFFTGFYESGSKMMRVKGSKVEVLWEIGPEVFQTEQQTPVFYQGYLYGTTSPDGERVCLDLNGQRVWASKGNVDQGRGPLLVADGKLLIMGGSGKLTIAPATPEGFKPYGEIQVLSGMEAWGPMALVGNLLLVRDYDNLACVRLGG